MNNNIYQTPIQKRSRAADFRRMARNALKNRWLLAVGIFLLASILGAFSGGFGGDASVNVENQNVDASMLEQFKAWALAGEYMELFDQISMLLWGKLLFVVLITVVISIVFSILFNLFVGGPTAVGYARFNLDLIDGTPNLGAAPLFSGFRTCYLKSVGVRVLLTLIQFAVSLITVIPAILLCLWIVLAGPLTGDMWILRVLITVLILFACAIGTIVLSVIVSYQYRLCTYILAEYPTLGVIDVLRNSRTLMRGNKWRLFCLEFSFLGWILLAVCCSCGLGSIVLSPYMYAAEAAFYDEISGRATAREVEFPSLDFEDYFQN